MARIVDYASLVQAILDFSHRAALSGYVDYFIQGGEERIYSTILELNEGEGLRWMEAPLNLTIDGLTGIAPIPTDYLAIKNAILLNGAYEPDLIVKEVQWIRARYRNTQYQGPPSYMARDVNSVFVGSITDELLTVSQVISGTPGVGQPLFGPGIIPGTFIESAGSSPLTYNLSVAYWSADSIGITADSDIATADSAGPIASETMTSGGFIFGPYPDDAYQIGGAYYQKAAALSSENATTWMTSQIPFVFLDACLAEVAKFLKDSQGESARMQSVADRLAKIVLVDKAERYAGGSLVISCV